MGKCNFKCIRSGNPFKMKQTEHFFNISFSILIELDIYLLPQTIYQFIGSKLYVTSRPLYVA